MYMDEFENKYFSADTAPFKILALQCAPGAVPLHSMGPVYAQYINA